jgi:hypothetical protein
MERAQGNPNHVLTSDWRYPSEWMKGDKYPTRYCSLVIFVEATETQDTEI